jgi:hypothetical protein
MRELACGICVLIGMEESQLKLKFAKLGARAVIRPMLRSRWRAAGPILIDIGRDRNGEFFDIQTNTGAEIEVLDIQPRDKHLLLLARQRAERSGDPEIKR